MSEDKEIKPADNKRLTLKQQRFTDEYISNGGNGTAAARIAYYKENRTDNQYAVIAKQNIRKSQIAQAIAAKQPQFEQIVKNSLWTYELARAALENLLARSLAANRVSDAAAVLRELNDISGLHKQRYIDETETQPEALSDDDISELKRLSGVRLQKIG